jgi:hypothetical protein
MSGFSPIDNGLVRLRQESGLAVLLPALLALPLLLGRSPGPGGRV